MTRKHFELDVRGARFRLGAETKLMGILNVTPDSFSDGGKYLDPARAEERALKLQDEGAHLIDIGGESSRPGSDPVSSREEIRRILPVLKRLSKKIQIPLSIDTCKYDVASAALDHGASMINDITALSDLRMARLIARHRAAVVLMHMRGTPRTMQKKPSYRSVVSEVSASLRRSVARAVKAGIARERIAVDPGFGFGKTVEHNLALLKGLDAFAGIKLPVLVGLSRKSFIGSLLGTPVEDRLAGSLAAASVAIARGAHILRVHDVAAHRQLAALIDRTMES